VVKHVFVPHRKDQDQVNFPVLYTDDKHPKYPSDGQILGYCELDMLDLTGGKDRQIEVQFKFGEVEFSLTAIDLRNGNSVKKEFKYL